MLKKIALPALFCMAPLSAIADDAQAYTWANVLTLESITNLEGGIETGTRNLANLDVSLVIDTQSAGWWSNGTVFMYVLGTYGKPPSAITGELQTLSNIEAFNNLSVYEFWYQHSFAEGAIKFLIGLHDYNSTFYSLESAGLFTFSSLGVGPEVAQIGTSIFPTTSAAVHLTFSHGDQYFLLAAYDGIPGDPDHPHGTDIILKKTDGILSALEWGFASESNYKFGIGAWHTSAEVESPVDGQLIDENFGYYLIGEKYFSEKLAAFFQYGRTDDDKNQLNTYSGLGFTYSGIWGDDDSLGVGCARAKNGSAFLGANPDLLSAETITELTYARPLIEKLSVQTSLYYVDNPSMSPDVDDAIALGVRLYIEL